MKELASEESNTSQEQGVESTSASKRYMAERSAVSSSKMSLLRHMAVASNINRHGHFDRNVSVSRLALQAKKALESRRWTPAGQRSGRESSGSSMGSKRDDSQDESRDSRVASEEGREDVRDDGREDVRDGGREVDRYQSSESDERSDGSESPDLRNKDEPTTTKETLHPDNKTPMTPLSTAFSDANAPMESCPDTPVTANRSSAPNRVSPTVPIDSSPASPSSPQQQQQQPFDMSKLDENMHMPPPKIKDLLTVIASQPSGPRRMNACGALKTLSNIPANRVQLAWTKGVVPTLAYVLNDEYASLTEKQRSASTLLNLCMPKHNHTVVFQSPGFIDGISNSLRSICLKTKHTASQCVDILAKHDDNKIPMWNEHNLIQAITDLISSSFDNLYYDHSTDNVSNAGTTTHPKPDDHKLAYSARLHCLLALRHLSRVRHISHKFARNFQTINTLLAVSGSMDSAANAVAIAIFADLTRHPQNALQLVYHVSGFLPALVKAARSPDPKSRQYACYAIANLSCSMGCRQELATTKDLLSTLSDCGLNENFPDEQIAAIGALKNISNDASNFIHLSNTCKCFHTLTSLTSNSTNVHLQYLACDTLATLAYWVAASASAGMNLQTDPNTPITKEMIKPTLNVETWSQWH